MQYDVPLIMNDSDTLSVIAHRLLTSMNVFVYYHMFVLIAYYHMFALKSLLIHLDEAVTVVPS